jgi:hypothetical protein
MKSRSWSAAAAALCFLTLSGPSAQAQWGFPGGFGEFGWGGWGGGVGTHEGDVARGMGMFAMGVGQYNKHTAVADSINVDTVKRWNQYVHEAQMESNRRRREQLTNDRNRTVEAVAATQKRLRDNPEPRDILQGDALNVALDEITDPRVYYRILPAARERVGGANIRAIPFRYGAAAITVGLHQLATEAVPAPLRTPEFEADREAFKRLDQEIVRQIAADQEPDPKTVNQLLAAIYAAEDKAAKTLRPNSLESKQADRYLKALHGLVVMLKAPALDDILDGSEKRADASLGDLLNFMTSFNLRFGPAVTPPQRQAYTALYPQLVKLRDESAKVLAGTTPKQPAVASAASIEDFFSTMTYDDLRKKAPKP